MVHFVGLDVSVKETSACVVDDAGKVILEQKSTISGEVARKIVTSPSFSSHHETADADLEEKREPRVALSAGAQKG